ncbi:phosphatidylglycerophosphatase B [compost metagenome]
MRSLGLFYGLGLGLSALALLTFAWLSENVLDRDLRAFNTAVSLGVHTQAHPVFDRLALALTEWGGLVGASVVAFVVTAYLIVKRRFGEATAFWVTLGGGAALGWLLKRIFQQPRPDAFEPLVAVGGFSYPSGHSLLSSTLYGYLAALVILGGPRQPGRWAAAVGILSIPIAVMWSRIYLGAHWVSDVVAGGLVATVWVCTCLMLHRRAISES